MSVEAPQIGRISDAKVNSIAGFFGESTFHHISCGEEGNRAIVLVEDVYGAYVLKKKISVPNRNNLPSETGRRLRDYEVNIIQLLGPHSDTAPVGIPTFIYDDWPSGVIAVDYMPGQTLDDMQIASMKPSEKCELGKKLAQYVHWFAQAIPLGSKAFENTYNDEESRRFDKRALLLDTDQARLSRDLEEVGQYTLASVRDEQVQQYIKMRNEGIITERTLVGHNDLKPSNFVFNSDLEGNLVLTSVIDYEATKPSTPEQEFRRTPQMGEDVMYIAIEEYERLTGIVLDPEVIKFWERVHFVGWAVNSALRSFADNDRVVLTRELRRTYPDQDWREVSGEITYSSSV